MKTFAAFCSVFALTQAASLLPLESSVVNVKSERNGQDYSYSIHENRRGIPIEHFPLQPLQPILQPLANAEIKTSSVERQQGAAQPMLPQEMLMQNPQNLELKSRQPDNRVQMQQQTSILPLQLSKEQYIPIQYTAYYQPLGYQQYQYYYPYNLPLQQYLYRI